MVCIGGGKLKTQDRADKVLARCLLGFAAANSESLACNVFQSLLCSESSPGAAPPEGYGREWWHRAAQHACSAGCGGTSMVLHNTLSLEGAQCEPGGEVLLSTPDKFGVILMLSANAFRRNIRVNIVQDSSAPTVTKHESRTITFAANPTSTHDFLLQTTLSANGVPQNWKSLSPDPLTPAECVAEATSETGARAR